MTQSCEVRFSLSIFYLFILFFYRSTPAVSQVIAWIFTLKVTAAVEGYVHLLFFSMFSDYQAGIGSWTCYVRVPKDFSCLVCLYLAVYTKWRFVIPGGERHLKMGKPGTREISEELKILKCTRNCWHHGGCYPIVRDRGRVRREWTRKPLLKEYRQVTSDK